MYAIQKRIKATDAIGGFTLIIIDFVKKNYEIFVVNFIVLGFIAFTLVSQFGVHIEVDKDVDLVPVKTEYSQSTMRVNRKITRVAELYVRLEYKNNAQESFWMPASVVFGRAGEDEIKNLIEDGSSIKRNVFVNTSSNEVIGVTESGRTILSLYYYNSKFFRYGILLLIICDILSDF